MRTAICMYGKVGGTHGKDGSGAPIDFKLCYAHMKQHVIDINNCDVFMHSWSVEFEKELTELYQPKKKIFEPQIVFDTQSTNPITKRDEFRGHSRWYSTKQVLGLKSAYEVEQGFKYDWVMLVRYDLAFFVDFDFSKLEPGFLYASNFNRWRDKTTGKPDRCNQTPTTHRIIDMWFVASSDLTDKFSIMGDCFCKYDISDVHSSLWVFIETFADPIKLVRYIFYRSIDYEVYRVWKRTGK